MNMQYEKKSNTMQIKESVDGRVKAYVFNICLMNPKCIRPNTYKEIYNADRNQIRIMAISI